MRAEKARKSIESTEKWLKSQGEVKQSKKRSLSDVNGDTGTDGKKGKREQGKPFQRIDSEKELASIEHKELLDNSYEGTFGSDGWGAKVHFIVEHMHGRVLLSYSFLFHSYNALGKFNFASNTRKRFPPRENKEEEGILPWREDRYGRPAFH